MHIKELDAKPKKSELKLKVYEKLIEVTNRELDTDIIKNRSQVVRELVTEKGLNISAVCWPLGNMYLPTK